MNPADTLTIPVDQLTVGMHVRLDLKWFQHPFAFSHFTIRSQDQIQTIRSLGLRSVRIHPDLGEAAVQTAPPAAPSFATLVTPPDATASPPETPPEAPPEATSPVLQAKRAMMEQMRRRREAAEHIENAFVSTASTVRHIEKQVYQHPQEAITLATQLVDQIADSILVAPELAIQVMGDHMGGEELYFHSLNVTMLTLMMAREIQLPHEVLGTLGLGALLHDIGLKEVPDRIVKKADPLTLAERHFYELHCQYGFELGQRMHLPAGVLAIIREHHELYDGSGYPAKLAGEKANLLARIVAIANYYDELCNPVGLSDALTPHEALSIMFAKQRSKFDPKILQAFIRCLGVYPPGTVVQLSNGAIAMVATVNTARPMKPLLVVYDADIPRDEAMLIDMDTETDVNIARAIRPAQLPREVYTYLSPRKRVSYYFDASIAGHKASTP